MGNSQLDADVLTEDIYKMLSESGYSDKAIKYIQEKEKIGLIENADQVTNLTGPCGDTMKISLSIENGTIDDAKIQVLGCPGAVASGCALVSLARGKTIQEAKGIDLEVLYKELERLPDQKVHCARLAIKTLHKALDQYTQRDKSNRNDNMRKETK
jgi:nitrogen fixation NifU-like protein